MSIVMGWDQHRAQITAEWLDTETGEVSRSRVAPADRASVRRFLGVERRLNPARGAGLALFTAGMGLAGFARF
jgi:hypothetical protein